MEYPYFSCSLDETRAYRIAWRLSEGQLAACSDLGFINPPRGLSCRRRLAIAGLRLPHDLPLKLALFPNAPILGTPLQGFKVTTV